MMLLRSDNNTVLQAIRHTLCRRLHDSVPETGKWLRSVLQGYYHTVAAAESAIGLAILVVLFRNRNTINVDDLDTMGG
jgi:NADH-ubiquinone/plastoquinone oxidoreductase subunit 4L